MREQSHVGGWDGVGVDLQQERHHLEHVREKFCRQEASGRRVSWFPRASRSGCSPEDGLLEVERLTLNIVLEDFSEDWEKRFLEAADSGCIGLAGDADGQAQRLKQVVVKVRLAGILK